MARSWLISSRVSPRFSPHPREQVEDLGRDRGVQRGRRLIGDEDLRVGGQCHGEHRPLLLSAGEAVRVFLEPPHGILEGDLAQPFRGLGARLPTASPPVEPDGLDELLADRPDRIERRRRLLEEEPDPRRPDRFPLPFRDRGRDSGRRGSALPKNGPPPAGGRSGRGRAASCRSRSPPRSPGTRRQPDRGRPRPRRPGTCPRTGLRR